MARGVSPRLGYWNARETDESTDGLRLGFY